MNNSSKLCMYIATFVEDALLDPLLDEGFSVRSDEPRLVSR